MASNVPPSPSSNLPVAIGELIAGKYLVERVLGEGGMGVVLAAHHRELDRNVVIKLLLPELAAVGMAAERFRREARASARIRGEHVCQVIDVGTLDNGVPFMVMEYLEGHDLASELELRGKLPYAEAVSYALQACDAVATAHAQGIIHRDIKPANLFLERCNDDTRRIKVLDFGVSKSLLETHSGASALTQTSNLLGSPLYMSPEQLDSAKGVDERTDVWSLGVVLYELITGRVPFDGESIAQLVTAVLQATPRSLREYAPEVPFELQAIVARALSRSRDNRWRSVVELAQALAPFAAHQPALPHLARMSSLMPPALLSAQPGAASRRTQSSDDGAPNGSHGGDPKSPRWVWLGVALALGLLALIAQRWHTSAAPRPSAETAQPPAAAQVPTAALAQPNAERTDLSPSPDLPTDLSAATDPQAAAPTAALDAAVEAEAPTQPTPPANTEPSPAARRPEVTAPPAPIRSRAATPVDSRAQPQPPGHSVPPISNFGGRR